MMTEQRKPGDPRLGDQLREIRVAAGLTQAQLATTLGVTAVQVSRIETGSRSTSIDILHRWHRACGYELDAVQVGTAEQATTLALAMATLPKDQIDAVIEIIEAWPNLPEIIRGRILGLIDAHKR